MQESEFLTQTLFSRGDRLWNGKIFVNDNFGTNRFITRDGVSQTEHKFELLLSPSKIDPEHLSLVLRYNPFQSFFSLWRTMRDEMRVLRLDLADGEVMIGAGCMAGSGGMLNASPFCAYRKSEIKVGKRNEEVNVPLRLRVQPSSK